MMIDEPIIPGGGQSLPLFKSGSAAYYYRVAYFAGKTERSLQYNSVHELILNLTSFKDTDKITYVSREDGIDFLTLTVGKFKISVATSFYSTTDDDLELLYLRLLLTNRFSKNIPDKGRFRQLDFTFRKYLTTLKGGIDSYLMPSDGKNILYLKYRRLSSILYIPA